MRKLKLTAAMDRYDRQIQVGETKWRSLADRLTTIKVTSETFEEYKASKNKLAIKDVGWFIGGPMKPVARRKANLQHRDVLTLDADHLDPWDMDYLVEHFVEQGYTFVCHSSHSHSEADPRLRFVFPFARPVTPDEYEPIARKVAGDAGIELFDDTTYQVSRIMFWPSRSKDGDVFVHDASDNGEWIDPDKILSQYSDWKDWAEWPSSERETLTRDPSKKADSPYDKPGVIGIFNRCYEVPHAIEEFDLPYVSSGMGENRYSYTGGSSVDGAVYYPDDGHLYSWHESDPARGNRNAWDLVRIHHFGDQDAGVADDIRMGERPSHRAMQAFAMGLPAVAAEMAAADGFDALPPADTADNDEQPTTAKGDQGPDSAGSAPATQLSYKGIRSQIDDRSAPFGREERQDILRRLAAAKLSPDDEDELLVLLKDASDAPVTKKALVDTVRSLRRQMASGIQPGDEQDIELDMMEFILDKYFEGGEHLRRFARQFWTYKGGVWKPIEDEIVRGRMAEAFFKLRRERPDDARRLIAAIGDSDTSTLVNKLWTLLCALVAERHASDDPLRLLERVSRPILNTRNCQIDFNRKGAHRMTPHDPSLFLTAQVAVDYEPDADTSHWDAFCDLLFHDLDDAADMKRHLEEVGGYILQPWRDLATIFMMRGAPAAGKSTFAELLVRLLGTSSLVRPLASYESNTHATAGLVGKLVLIDEDYNTGDLLPAGFLKTVSEERMVTANPKGKDEFNFVCRAVPLILTNDWPPARDYSGALQRRMICWDLPAIPLDKQSLEARNELLTKGLAGSLVAMVNGFKRLYRRGYWNKPKSCLMAAETWTLHSDGVRLFLRECFEKVPGEHVKKSDLFGWYQHWHADNNPYGRHIGRNKFLERVASVLGAAGADADGTRIYRDLRYRGIEFDD